MSVRTPFPINKYAHLEILNDTYIIDGNKVIAVMNDFFPTEDMELDYDEIEDLIKQGYSVKDYEEYILGTDKISVKVYELNGYPEKSVTCDLFDMLYYKHVCIGRISRNFVGEQLIIEPNNLEHARLDDLGIEYSYMYGLSKKGMFQTVMVNHAIPLLKIIGYKHHTLNPWVKSDDRVIIIRHDGDSIIIGQLDDQDKLQVISNENLNKYTAMGLKPPIDEYTKPLVDREI